MKLFGVYCPNDKCNALLFKFAKILDNTELLCMCRQCSCQVYIIVHNGELYRGAFYRDEESIVNSLRRKRYNSNLKVIEVGIDSFDDVYIPQIISSTGSGAILINNLLDLNK